MSYLRYLCLFTHSGVQHILCCVFVLFVFVLCTLCCQFLWIVYFWLLLRYSLMFMHQSTYCNIIYLPEFDFVRHCWWYCGFSTICTLFNGISSRITGPFFSSGPDELNNGRWEEAEVNVVPLGDLVCFFLWRLTINTTTSIAMITTNRALPVET